MDNIHLTRIFCYYCEDNFADLIKHKYDTIHFYDYDGAETTYKDSDNSKIKYPKENSLGVF